MLNPTQTLKPNKSEQCHEKSCKTYVYVDDETKWKKGNPEVAEVLVSSEVTFEINWIWQFIRELITYIMMIKNIYISLIRNYNPKHKLTFNNSQC